MWNVKKKKQDSFHFDFLLDKEFYIQLKKILGLSDKKLFAAWTTSACF